MDRKRQLEEEKDNMEEEYEMAPRRVIPLYFY